MTRRKAGRLGRLGVLLPITSRGCTDLDTIEHSLRRLRSSFDPPPSPPPQQQHQYQLQQPQKADDDPWDTHDSVCVCFGVDEDDAALQSAERMAGLKGAFADLDVHLEVFPSKDLRAQGGAAPVCWMWGRLAEAAVQKQKATHFVLLGDDTHLAPCGWPQIVLHTFADFAQDDCDDEDSSVADAHTDGPTSPHRRPRCPRRPRRPRCLALLDVADPGYPSFPVLDAEHLHVFGSLFPPGIFVNQMGDPFLAELYRRLGGLRLAPEVVVTNATGGIQLPDAAAYVPPRYSRIYPRMERVLQALDDWTAKGAAVWGAGPTTVDVLIPCGRANEVELRRIVEECERLHYEDDVDVRFGVVVDTAQPRSLPSGVRAALDSLRNERLGRMRLRYNEANRGASRTRNRMMDESLAQLLVLLDDDVEPQPGLVAAYVRAAEEHPEARGFAGPTYLPCEGSAWAHAVHMSDVAFFWLAPASRLVGVRPDGTVWLPWCVTANMAVRNTPHRFDPRFPRTGGGEDIDFCLRACPDWLLAVPEAACKHPLWNKGRPHILRFGHWAVGDGQLIEMYGSLTYRAAPNASESLMLLGVLLAAALLLELLAIAAAQAAAPLLPVLLPPPLAQALGTSSAGAAAAAVAGAARRVAVGSAVAGVTVGGSEFLLEMIRHCASPARLARHPCPSWSLRLHAAAIAAVIRNVSEAGRLYGHLLRAFGLVVVPTATITTTSNNSGGSGGSREWGGGGQDASAAAANPEVMYSGGSDNNDGEGGMQGGGIVRLAALVCLRFDWFCGLDRGVVRQEQARAAARAAVQGVTAMYAVAWALGEEPAPLGGWLVLAAVWVVASAVVAWRD